MSATLDEIAPDYIGEDRIVLTITPRVAASTAPPGSLAYMTPVTPPAPDLRAFNLVTIYCYYDECAPEGVVLPLEMIVRGPSKGSYKRKFYLRTAPTVLRFKPLEGGSHLIMLREVAHNRWWGRIKVDVKGPTLNRPRVL